MPDMQAYVPGGDVPDSDADPRIVATRHLLAARSQWVATVVRSLMAVLAYVVGVSILDDITNGSTGPIATVAKIIGLALAAFAVAALVIVAGETLRLRGLDPDIRAQAASQEKAASRPSRRRGRASAPGPPASWQFRVFIGSLLALWLLVMAGFMPQQVNAVAYLAGSGATVRFAPQSYFQNCGARGPCTTMTDGILLTDPQVRATWPHQAPLHRQFAVRRPVWAGWSAPVQLMDGTWAALLLVFGAFLDLISAGVLTGLIYTLRRRLRHRRDAAHQPYVNTG